jgi:hypothetical protein
MTLPVFTGVPHGDKVTVTIPEGFHGECLIEFPNASGGTTRIKEEVPPPLPAPSADHVFVDALGSFTACQPPR